MEEDLIIGEEVKGTDYSLDIIDNQLIVINSVLDIDNDIYDDLQADKIKILTNAMKIIQKIQKNLLKDLA